ncbi:sigma-70 family RNA polymerase sigma factor [Streptomyces xiaopingdaonensis]|uniref:sigma-70 family RNA polymerase sigma factor n=1 Tax=Streptomyces xiaopingdaonensis TaxID=1565415 RepID=UPI00031AF15A|nr:sigma-70 family RNA polymerase sigma factor [Streptomyces xiaopingdaonensis]
MANDTPTRWDRKMQQRLVRGEAAALGELYDRFGPLVHSLAHRALGGAGGSFGEDPVDRVTKDVFAQLWEHPEAYDPRHGPLRSWLADATRQAAERRLRSRQSGSPPRTPLEAERAEQKVRAASAAARADYIVGSMPASLRAALELAYFQRQDYRQAARRLGVTEDEARRRLRLGLQLLSTAVPEGPAAPPRRDGAPGQRR